MILTDDGWREVKLGRVFGSADIAQGKAKERGQGIEKSCYAAHLGGHQVFCQRMAALIEPYRPLDDRLIFLSDGARWIEKWITKTYPNATQILDFYHAVSHLSAFSEDVFADKLQRQLWVEEQKTLLLEAKLETLIAAIRKVRRNRSKTLKQKARTLIGYYLENRTRMAYDHYLEKGYYIGSGAIESAHRTVVHRR